MSDAQAVLAKLNLEIAALEKTISPADDPPPQYEAQLEIIQRTLESPETQTALKSEIEKLTTAAQDVEVAFLNVSRGLERILAMAQKGSDDPQKVKKLQEHKVNWDDLYEKYTALVWESRRVAGNARAVALDFATDFLDLMSDRTYSVEQKKEEITAYRQELEKDMQNANKLSDSFKDLCRSVGSFKESIYTDLKTWANEATKKITDLLNEMEKVQKSLELAIDDSMTAAITGVCFGLGAAALFMLGSFYPGLWFSSAMMFGYASLRLMNASRKYHELLRQRNELKNELQAQAKSAEKLMMITASAGNLENDMSFIQQKLAVFTSVWQIISSDLTEIEKNLDLAKAGRTQRRFEDKMRIAATGYKNLAIALRLYETNVHITRSH